MHRTSLRCLLALVGGLCSLAVFAAEQVPQGVEPGQMSRRFEVVPEPRPSPEPFVIEAPLLDPLPGSDAIRFELGSLTIDGNTRYGSEDLLEPYQTLIGREISLADLNRIAKELTARYRNDGYILSQAYVPAQKIDDGNVRLTVIEGYVANVSFQGEVEGRRGMLRKIAARIENSRPLEASVLERNLLLLNDLPGVFARGTLLASAAVDGASELVVSISHDSLALNAHSDNHSSRFLGPAQMGIGLTLNSVLALYESTTLGYIQAYDSEELQYGYVTHTQSSSSGVELTLSASRSRSEPGLGEDFAAFNLESESDDASLRLRYPLLRSRATNLYLFSRLTYHDGETSSDFITEQTNDVISAIRAGIELDWIDGLLGVNLLQLEVSRGLDIFGASSVDDERLSRPGGDPEFAKATLYAARLQSIAPRWSVLLAVQGQYSFDNVLSPEEFAFGGAVFGRAYDPSELVGDHGAAGKVEIRYSRQSARGSGFTLYSFYDVGFVEQKLDPGELVEDERESGAAAGLGIRFSLSSKVTGFIEGAVPLTRPVAAEGNDDPRVFGGLRVQF